MCSFTLGSPEKKSFDQKMVDLSLKGHLMLFEMHASRLCIGNLDELLDQLRRLKVGFPTMVYLLSILPA